MIVMMAAQTRVPTMYTIDGTAMTSRACQKHRSSSMSPSNGFESDRYAPRRAAEPGTPVGAGCAAVAIVRSSVFSELLGHEVEVEGGQDEVQEEEQQERDDHGLVDG